MSLLFVKANALTARKMRGYILYRVEFSGKKLLRNVRFLCMCLGYVLICLSTMSISQADLLVLPILDVLLKLLEYT